MLVCSVLLVDGGLLGKTSAETKKNLNKCIDVINQINAATDQGNENACLNCDPTLGVCPGGCSLLITTLWAECSGVTLPDGIYFDPKQTMTGTLPR